MWLWLALLLSLLVYVPLLWVRDISRDRLRQAFVFLAYVSCSAWSMTTKLIHCAVIHWHTASVFFHWVSPAGLVLCRKKDTTTTTYPRLPAFSPSPYSTSVGSSMWYYCWAQGPTLVFSVNWCLNQFDGHLRRSLCLINIKRTEWLRREEENLHKIREGYLEYVVFLDKRHRRFCVFAFLVFWISQF